MFIPEITEEKQLRVRVPAYEFNPGNEQTQWGKPYVIRQNDIAEKIQFVTDSGANYDLEIIPKW
jgi:hypothetical protein